MTKLDISPSLQLPEDAVTRSFAFLAMKGAGKSNALVVMAEEMFKVGVPWVAIDPKGDWWGIRSSADGKAGGGLSVPIFGGLHADVPLEAGNGALMADLVVDQHLTCLVDVSEMTKGDSIKFLTAFFERLYRRKNRETYPMHLFLEECDDYIPQRVYKEISNLVRQVELCVKRGRQRGIGITLASQRAASINKDALTQTDNLIAMRNTSPQDRKAVKEWIDYHASAANIIDELPTLQDGEAWVSSPEHLRILKKIRFHQRETFDSGATPALGSKVKPATLTDIDIEAISTAFAETIEKAKQKDPKMLLARVNDLERKVKSYERELERERAKKEVVPQDVPYIPQNVLDGLATLEHGLSDLLATEQAVSSGLNHAVDKARATLINAQKVAKSQPALDDTRRRESPKPAATARGQSPRAAGSPSARGAQPPASVESDFKLGKGERKVLAVLRQWPEGRSQKDLHFLTGYSASSSTLGVYLSKLRQMGIVEEGQPVRLTEAGMAAAGGVEELPTGDELLEHWRNHKKVGSGRKVLDVLVDTYPKDLTHEELCDLTGYSPDASTVGVYLSHLRKLGLVSKSERKLDDQFAESIGL